jgi:peptidoglycan/LPS O-acetylase OafA/YrhL
MTPKVVNAAFRHATVDGLRALAAFAVLIMHCVILGNSAELALGAGRYLTYGWLGVDLFLVISGYATSRALLMLMARGSSYAQDYWRDRLARIVPLYLLTSACFLLLVNHDALRGPDAWFQLLTHVTLTHGFFPSTAGSINGVTWTLSLELSLYLLGFLILRFAGIGFKPTVSVRGLWFFISATVITVFTLRFAVYSHFLNQGIGTTVHWLMTLPCAFDGFALGLCLAVLEGQRPRLFKQRFTTVALNGVLALLLVVLVFVVLDRAEGSYWASWHFPVLYRTFVAFAGAHLVVCALLVAHFEMRGGESLFNNCKTCAAWVCVRLAELSYGIYLWHLIVILLLVKHTALEGLPFLLTTLVCTIALSIFSYYGLERPINQWSKSRRRAW